MIRLTKLNNDQFVLNSNQIECIEIIPESKVIMANKDFFIVKESVDEIIEKIIAYNAKIHNYYKNITVVDNKE
ncbi:flagellar FlbD family protein [Anaerotignum faecicola]|nr:flagellar FlbD family protein [Anaerotignum faecicola]